jgi:hypothetical protein
MSEQKAGNESMGHCVHCDSKLELAGTWGNGYDIFQCVKLGCKQKYIFKSKSEYASICSSRSIGHCLFCKDGSLFEQDFCCGVCQCQGVVCGVCGRASCLTVCKHCQHK